MRVSYSLRFLCCRLRPRTKDAEYISSGAGKGFLSTRPSDHAPAPLSPFKHHRRSFHRYLDICFAVNVMQKRLRIQDEVKGQAFDIREAWVADARRHRGDDGEFSASAVEGLVMIAAPTDLLAAKSLDCACPEVDRSIAAICLGQDLIFRMARPVQGHVETATVEGRNQCSGP